MNWLHFVGLSSGSPHICPALVKVIYQTPAGNFIIQTFTWTQGWTDDDENEFCSHTLRVFLEIWHSDSFVLKKEPYKTDLWPWFKKLCANYTIWHKSLLGHCTEETNGYWTPICCKPHPHWPRPSQISSTIWEHSVLPNLKSSLVRKLLFYFSWQQVALGYLS